MAAASIRIPLLMLAVLAVGACAASDRSKTAIKAQKQMVGMTNEEVLTCMGSPDRRESLGETTVWTYFSGGETRVTSNTHGHTWQPTISRRQHAGKNPRGRKKGKKKHGFRVERSGPSITSSTTSESHKTMSCTVSVVMKNDRVERLNFAGRTGNLFASREQCGFVLANCVR